MTKALLIIILLLFITSCSQETAETKEEPLEQAAAGEAEEAEVELIDPVVSCEDADENDIYTYGKVVLHYESGQKESFKDRCIEEGSVFPVFLTEYTCDGLTAASKLYKCEKNCTKGACNR